jgi:hypothetical protein
VFSVRHELAKWEGIGNKQVDLNLETYQFAVSRSSTLDLAWGLKQPIFTSDMK